MANEVKFRPATMAEVEGRDVDLYMNGERVYVMMIMRSETIGEDSEPKLDYIWLRTCRLSTMTARVRQVIQVTTIKTIRRTKL